MKLSHTNGWLLHALLVVFVFVCFCRFLLLLLLFSVVVFCCPSTLLDKTNFIKTRCFERLTRRGLFVQVLLLKPRHLIRTEIAPLVTT